MNKNMSKAFRVLTYLIVFGSVFVISMLLTMTILIKGDEITTPEFVGKPIRQVRETALHKSIMLKEFSGDYGNAYPPQTVVNQFPSAGTSIKENSFVKVFVTSDLAQTQVPDVLGKTLHEAEKLLKENRCKRRQLSYILMKDVPFDTIISQSVPAGTRTGENSEVDLLVSRGNETVSYIMPDLIGLDADRVLMFFESRGLRVANIETRPYYGLKPGIVLKQSPDPGFEISTRNKIGIEVSQ